MGLEAQTWKNREKDWYNAERRFIFAAKDPKTRDKWIRLILETQIKDRIQEGIAKMMLINRENRARSLSGSPTKDVFLKESSSKSILREKHAEELTAL